MKPTLFRKGYIVPPEGASDDEKAKLADLVPIDYIADIISRKFSMRDASAGDKVIVIKAKTASGKSTVVPPRIYADYAETIRGRNIACLQPRVMNAATIPEQIVEFNSGLKMGENIGYQTGPISEKPRSGIVFMTKEVLIQQLKTMEESAFMQKYAFIIVDECHERSLSTDLVLYKLKKFLARNHGKSECPLVLLMSATFDAPKFASYFGSTTIIEIEGESYPVTPHFMEIDAPNVIKATLDAVVKIHTENTADYVADESLREHQPSPIRDILVFVFGAAHVRSLAEGLKSLNKSHPHFKKYPILVLKIDSSVVAEQGEEYNMIFNDLPAEYTRRVLLGTNVAETGVTIDTLKYVIDIGLHKAPEFHPTYAANVHAVRPVARSMALQRRGRVGRKAPGEWYPLYTEDTFNQLPVDQMPDILKTELTSEILDLLCEEYGIPNGPPLADMSDFAQKKVVDLTSVDLLDPIPADSIQYSIEKLYKLGAITRANYPTRLGILMSKFRKIPIDSVRMILSGYAWGAPIEDLVMIAVMMQNDFVGNRKVYAKKIESGYFALPKTSDNVTPADFVRSMLIIADDYISAILIFYDFTRQLKRIFENEVEYSKIFKLQKWCEDRGLSYPALKSAIELRDEVITTLVMLGMNPYGNREISLRRLYDRDDNDSITNYMSIMDTVRLLKHCIYDGYRMNLAVWQPDQQRYVVDRTGFPIKIDSRLIYMTPNKPKYIIFSELLLTQDQSRPIYVSNIRKVSVMDGFVNVI